MGALILQSDWPACFFLRRTDNVERGSISVTVGPSGSGPAEPGVRAHGRREGDGLHARGSMTCGPSLSHACHATSQPSYSLLVNT